MQTKDKILSVLKNLKPKYEKEGVVLLGLFGSYAQGRQTDLSDIDIVYRLNYDKFSKKYADGFSKLLRLDAIKEDLEKRLKTKVDFLPDKNKIILDEVLYV